jgi:hypothetical protein
MNMCVSNFKSNTSRHCFLFYYFRGIVFDSTDQEIGRRKSLRSQHMLPGGQDTGKQESYPGDEQVAGEPVSRRNSRNTHLGVDHGSQEVGQGAAQVVRQGVGQGVGHGVFQGGQQLEDSRQDTATVF